MPTGRGFWNNVDIIRDAAAQGGLHVLRIPDVGFRWPFAYVAARTSIDILEVHPGYRRQGHGNALARHCIDLARQADVGEITVQCEPRSSVPFWRAIGFGEMDGCLGDSSGCRQMRMVLT